MGCLLLSRCLTIDEIKSTGGDLERISEDGYPVHWAQAMFYAYMYAKEHGEPLMRVQLTYVQTETEEERRFVREASYRGAGTICA